MTIRLFDKLVSAFGGPYADANLVEVDNSAFTGNLASLSSAELQAVANAVDGLNLGLTDVTSASLVGTTLQIQFGTQPPNSPVTVNVDLSALQSGGGTGNVDVQGTPTSGQIAVWVDADTVRGIDRLNINQVAFATSAVEAASITRITTQAQYEARRNTEAITTITSTSATVYGLPSLASRPGWYRPGDIFIYTNSADSTRSVALQVGANNDTIPGDDVVGNGGTLNIAPGDSVAVRLPASGRTWERVAYTSTIAGSGGVTGSGANMMGSAGPNPLLPISPWAYNAENALQHRGNVTVDNLFEIVQDSLRSHVTAMSQSNNEASVTFSDDVGMVQWWASILPNQAELDLGNNAQDFQDSLDADEPQQWIETNVVTSYNFALINRDSELSVTSASLNSANHVRLGLSGNVNPFYMGVNRYVRISGASDPRLNGEWRIAESLTTHIVIEVPGVTTTDIASNTGGTINQVWYASIAPSVNAANRTFPFYLFLDPARSVAATGNIATHQFDIASSNNEFSFMVDIAQHLPSVLKVIGNMVAEDEQGVLYSVPTGSRDAINNIDNTGADRQFRVYLDARFRYHTINCDAHSEIYLDFDPADLNPGQTRVFTIVVSGGVSFSGYGFYALALGREGAIRSFDNGLQICYIPPNGQVEIMFYNDGNISGARILTPIQRTREQLLAYQADTTLSTTIADRLPISHSNRNQQNDEDPTGFLIGWGGNAGVPANTVRARAAGEYVLNYELTVKFNGAEGTGLLFVPVSLTPFAGTNRLSQHRVTGTLLFSRNGESGANAPKYELSMKSNFRYITTGQEDFHWRLEFGVFPAGYSISDLQIFNAGAEVTAQLNLK